MAKKKLTEEQIKEMCKLYTEEEILSPELGKIFGISLKLTLNYLKLNNIKMKRRDSRKIKGDQITEICNLYKSGSSSAEIGKMFNVVPGTILQHLKNNNVAIRVNKLDINPGDKFSRWTVIKEDEQIGNTRYFICECSCPLKTRKRVQLRALRNGMSQSCSCLNKEINSKRGFNSGVDYTGQTFGKLTILQEAERERHETRQVIARCSCDGNISKYYLARLKSGETTSCGCYAIENTKETNTLSLKDYEEKYPFFYQVEEMIKNPDGYGVLVKCKKCDKWFPPTNGQLTGRISALERPGTRSLGTENNFYCSEKCKQECDTYNTQLTPKSLRNIKKASRCHQQINRKALLDLQEDEFGYTHCEVCGKPFPREELIIHHNVMVGKDHTMADDMSHQIIVCKEHHSHKDC